MERYTKRDEVEFILKQHRNRKAEVVMANASGKVVKGTLEQHSEHIYAITDRTDQGSSSIVYIALCHATIERINPILRIKLHNK